MGANAAGSNRGCLIALGVLGVVALVGFWLVKEVERGLNGGVSRPAFDRDDPALVAEREEAASQQAAALDAFAGRTEDLLRPVGPHGTVDDCQAGAANWKYVDDAAMVCTLTTTQLFTFGGDVDSQVRAVADLLPSSPCRQDRPGDLASQLVDRGPYGLGTDAGSADAMLAAIPTGAGTCGPWSGTPSAEVLQVVRWFAATSGPADHAALPPEATATCSAAANRCIDAPIDVAAALDERAPEDLVAVAVTSSSEYFTQEWE